MENQIAFAVGKLPRDQLGQRLRRRGERAGGDAAVFRHDGEAIGPFRLECQGARLAIFDVTDPAHVKEEGSAQVDAHGAFDFVSSLGDYAELVRFRNGQGEAVLNLHKAKVPTLTTIPGLDLQGSTERLGDDGLIAADQPDAQSDANDPNYQVVDLSNPLHPNPVADVKQVLEKITNDETGTTFLLTANGLYLIRRPAVEEEYEIHEYQMEHPG